MQVGHAFIFATLNLLYAVLDFYVWIVIVSAILSWLVAFNIINTHNRFVVVVGDMLYRLTEPVYRRIRRFVPIVAGFDLAPLVLIFAIVFLKSFIAYLVAA